MKTINMSLENIDSAISEVFNYRYDLLQKCDTLRQRIAARLQAQAEAGFNGAVASDTYKVVDGKDVYLDSSTLANVDVRVIPGGENITIVVASGEDAVWVEFGAGVFYNGTAGTYPNPLAADAGMAAIGTYGKGRGSKNTWAFRGDDGLIHLTHGTPAAMPLYHAVQSVAQDFVQMAREVFGA